MISRFNKIQAALTKVGASQLDNNAYWSSSESSSENVYYVDTDTGYVNADFKDFDACVVRPFAIID